MPSFGTRDMMLILGLSLGIVVYYKAVKPMIDKYI